MPGTSYIRVLYGIHSSLDNLRIPPTLVALVELQRSTKTTAYKLTGGGLVSALTQLHGLVLVKDGGGNDGGSMGEKGAVSLLDAVDLYIQETSFAETNERRAPRPTAPWQVVRKKTDVLFYAHGPEVEVNPQAPSPSPSPETPSQSKKTQSPVIDYSRNIVAMKDMGNGVYKNVPPHEVMLLKGNPEIRVQFVFRGGSGPSEEGVIPPWVQHVHQRSLYTKSTKTIAENAVLKMKHLDAVKKQLEGSVSDGAADEGYSAQIQSLIHSSLTGYTRSKWHKGGARGLLLYGPPGTGKTYAVSKIFRGLDLKEGSDLILFEGAAADLNSKYVGEMEAKVRAWQRRAQRRPEDLHFVLLEEADTLLSGVSSGGGSSGGSSGFGKGDAIAVLLQVISDQPNIFWILTTNFKAQLDDRVVRSRRISIHVLFPGLSLNQRHGRLKSMAAEEFNTAWMEWTEWMKWMTIGWTHAQFTEFNGMIWKGISKTEVVDVARRVSEQSAYTAPLVEPILRYLTVVVNGNIQNVLSGQVVKGEPLSRDFRIGFLNLGANQSSEKKSSTLNLYRSVTSGVAGKPASPLSATVEGVTGNEVMSKSIWKMVEDLQLESVLWIGSQVNASSIGDIGRMMQDYVDLAKAHPARGEAGKPGGLIVLDVEAFMGVTNRLEYYQVLKKGQEGKSMHRQRHSGTTERQAALLEFIRKAEESCDPDFPYVLLVSRSEKVLADLVHSSFVV